MAMKTLARKVLDNRKQTKSIKNNNRNERMARKAWPERIASKDAQKGFTEPMARKNCQITLPERIWHQGSAEMTAIRIARRDCQKTLPERMGRKDGQKCSQKGRPERIARKDGQKGWPGRMTWKDDQKKMVRKDVQKAWPKKMSTKH